jgi:malonate-semialdehyde dehydrogenase (acetylating)/methylmalonate-semialdehyde dehydrogenase
MTMDLANPSIQQLTNRIGGQRPSSENLEMLPVSDPATGDELARVPISGPEEVGRAVEAARAAQPGWAGTSLPRRARLMFHVQQLVEAQRDELAELIALENGKALGDARGEVTRGLETLEFAAGIPHLMKGSTTTGVARGVDAETRFYPVGVVAGITPFNFPAMIPLWMIPLAIAAGNAFVLKPSEQTPLTSERLADLFAAAGLPDGVLNVVHGAAETAEALVTHPGVDAVSFVGSATVARHVYRTAAAAGKRVQALAGAKNFLIVLDDAPLEPTADAVFASAFGNAGQRCLAGSVVLATHAIAQPLTEALVGRVQTAPHGRGSDAGSVITPVTNAAAQSRILAAVDQAARGGARVLTGGRAIDGPGFFLAPTIIADARPDTDVVRKELFGPTLAMVTVSDLDEAIELANATEYGNSSSIFTSSGAAAHTFRERIEVGMLGINVGVPAPIGYLPFSGWKGSFYGDLHVNGMDGVRFYTRQKAITTRWLET